jgi:UPF0755 protein
MIKKILLIIAGLIIALAIILPIYIYRALGESAGSSTTPVTFRIEPGESTTHIMDRLYDQHLITNKIAFAAYVRLKHKSLKTGEFDLAPNYSLKTIIDTISSGEIKSFKVTIPEGWRIEQIAQRLDSQGIAKYADFMRAAAGNEGHLFPDTYEFKPDVTPMQIVQTMNDNFAKRTEGLTVAMDDLKLASIIEREAESDADRPGIAAVFANRLKIGMKLQSDVTVIYQKDTNVYPSAGGLNYKFWGKLASGDTTSEKGKYNLYLNAGLPPSPICNPGLPSIKAAVAPASSKYYYFLYGKDGKIYYASTQAEQDQNANKYLY